MAVLIFAGDIEIERAVELAKNAFGTWQVLTPESAIKLSELKQPGQTHIYLVDRPGSIQSQIRAGQLGITRHDDGYFVSRVVSNYFGWGLESRLNKSLRVEKGLTYGAWGSYIAHRFAGEFKVGTFSKTETTADAVKALLDEVKRLKGDGPTDDELSRSKSFMLGSFVRGRETPQQIAGDLWLKESQGLAPDYLEKLLEGISQADKEQCEKLITNTIDTSRQVIVVVGQAGSLKSQLERIAPVTVIPAE